VTITDGWINIFRLDDTEPVPEMDAFLAPGEALFGNGGGEAWVQMTLADALASMDRAGCERALLTVSDGGTNDVVTKSPPLEVGLEACARAGGRLRLAYALENVSNPARVAREIVAAGRHDEVAAVGVFPSYLRTDLDDRLLYPIYAACTEAGLPVRINVGIVGPQWSSSHQDPMRLERILLDFPDLVVLGAHMGHPWERLVMRLIMKFPNLHLLTSAYRPKYFDPELVRFMDSSRGRGRIMFASDFPMLPVAVAVDDARNLGLSDESLDEYLGTALCRVLGWQ
jgi:predicted TIM-barrel fold metal-dependent hydrolase